MKTPTKRQRELDQAYEKACAANDWRGNPDERAAEVSKTTGASAAEIRAAVFACQDYDEALTQKLY